MRKILNASECLTVKRNEQLRRKLRAILLMAVVELEILLHPFSPHVVPKMRIEILKTPRINECKEVEPLGQYFDVLYSKLSTNQELGLGYFTEPATMKLLELRRVVPKR